MDLPNFQSGQRLMAIQLQQLKNAIQAATIQKGVGYTFERSSGGTRLRIQSQAAGGGGSSQSELTALNRYPFRVVAGYVNPEAPDFPVVRIHGESYVSSVETGELFSITGDPGLGAILDSEDDNENDPGQFPLPEIGESIWLEGTVDGYSLTSVSIWFGQVGSEGLWENYPDPIEMSEPTEEDPMPVVVKTRCLIAHCVDGTDPRQGDYFTVGTGETVEYRKILQQLKTNVGVQVLMMRGVPAPVFVPWHGPFIIP
jgi:hypothetical protein